MSFYPDEARDPATHRKYLAADFAADPEALTKYEGLQGRDVRNRQRIAALEKELQKARDRVKRVEKDLQQTERRRRQVRDENTDLTRRLGSAHGALNAYRKETARLKEDLRRLRGSRSYKLGKRMVDPLGLRTRHSAPKALTELPTDTVPPELPTDTIPPHDVPADSVQATAAAGASQAQVAAGGQAVPARPGKLSDMSYQELLDWLEQEPSLASLRAVLTRSWYAEGLISKPAELLEQHPEVAAELTGKDAILPRRILGAARVQDHGFDLPPRARGIAYQPERGRIMYCAHSTAMFNTNGYSIRTHGMAKGLADAGEDVVVVGRPGYPWDSQTDGAKPAPKRHTGQLDGISYVHLPGSPLSGTRFDRYILESADAYVREARLLRPSLIHSASNYWTALPAMIAARRLGVPFVYEVRGLWEITEASDKPGWEQTERYAQQVQMETLVASEADAVLAITEETKDELIRRGVAGDKISLAPNAVDTTTYLPLPKDQQYAQKRGIDIKRPVIGFAGSMVTYEGLHLLLSAAAELAGREAPGSEPAFQVVLAGSGRAEESLKTLTRELGIDDRVCFLGRVPNSEIPRLLSLFDIMPLPRLSLPVTEMVSPLKPLEALSSGKAVVLSDVSPHRIFAGVSQERGLLFPAGDATALADILERLLTDADARTALGRAGRLWCLDNRTWTAVASGVIATHRAAAGSHDRTVESGKTRRLGSLRVGLVADEFTTSTLQGTIQVHPLDRKSWRDQIGNLDLVFIESAWEGNGGQWHRGIGRYSPEEHRDIVDLLAAARERGIPSVFWNKEDPVHFNRFVATASLCDHVFTTDAGRIPAYLEHGEGAVLTASALPFYAQPKIHNPLPTDRPFEATIAYAGTYYGDRYAKRSQELASMLTTALPFGLTIYDRQAALPDSPYHFPRRFEAQVRGSLPYDEVLKSYKSHTASINVNSVADSPSMFSRRVVEIAASGGVVVSGPGRGVSETFGTAIPCTGNPAEWRALFRGLSEDPQARLSEAWLQMRSVWRSHAVGTALTIVARTAGLAVTAPELPTYGVILTTVPEGGPTPVELVDSLLAQSVLPTEVVLLAPDDAAAARFASAGVSVLDDADNLTAQFVGRWDTDRPRTWMEDLLLACSFGDWQALSAAPADQGYAAGDPIAQPIGEVEGEWSLVARPVMWRFDSPDAALAAGEVSGLRLIKPLASPPTTPPAGLASHGQQFNTAPSRTRVLVAGHDLKFAAPFIATLKEQGFPVALDVWESHSDHDEERSLQLLQTADVVFCEWGLGNAEWYSKHVDAHQRLVVRVHSQELRRSYLSRIKHDRVSAYIFVGDLIREAAIQSHGVPRDRSVVIPNNVAVSDLNLPKHPDADRTIGLVGILPQSKRLDLALDVLETLLERDHTYRMRIRGKLPSELPWLKHRPDELQYFTEQFERIDALNQRHPDSVLVEGHGDDMAQWYRHVGVALSVSDFESFHLTIPDGAASGALPALLAWPGSDLIYPRDWICATVPEVVDRIENAPREPAAFKEAAEVFRADLVNDKLLDALLGSR